MSFQFITRSFKGLGVHYDCDHNRRVTEMYSLCGCRTGECFGNSYCINYDRRRECGMECENITCQNQNLQWINPAIKNHLRIERAGGKGNGLFVYNVDWNEHTVVGPYDGEIMDEIRYQQYRNHNYDQSYICMLGPRAYVNALHYGSIARFINLFPLYLFNSLTNSNII
jgi:hypothetical protein